MIKVTRLEADYLRANNLGHFVQVVNKTHKSNHKTYYVIEAAQALNCLNSLKQK